MNKTSTDKLRVLVVQQEPISREILSDFLKMAGYDVVSASTGEQALLTLVQERGQIDCLFTEVELSGLVDGWMLADEFRLQGANMPVVFATDAKMAETRRSEGAFVAHPVLPPKVVEAVNEAMGRGDVALRGPRLLARIVAETVAPEPGELQREVGVAASLLKIAS